jgi:carbon dioxide concentrating mechanism protein CcmL
VILARVKGNLVSTQKDKNLVGQKLLIVHPIDLEGNKIGIKDVIALDTVNSGIGDTVILVQEGKAVQQILGNKTTPAHSIIVAVVDSLKVN